MCSLTWLRQADGYRVFFNRDELDRRGRGLPPESTLRGGVEVLAPRDPDGGGTWIAVNGLGVSLCLLNHDGGSREAGAPGPSRGRVVSGLADAPTVAEVMRRLGAAELCATRPFRLAAFDPARAAVATWVDDGLRIEPLRDVDMPLCSSSRDEVRANEHRRGLLDRLRAAGPLDVGALRGFHRSHDPRPSAWTPCMHREDAHTVSYTEIHVRSDRVELSYNDGPPCTSTTRTPRTLALGRCAPSHPG